MKTHLQRICLGLALGGFRCRHQPKPFVMSRTAKVGAIEIIVPFLCWWSDRHHRRKAA